MTDKAVSPDTVREYYENRFSERMDPYAYDRKSFHPISWYLAQQSLKIVRKITSEWKGNVLSIGAGDCVLESYLPVPAVCTDIAFVKLERAKKMYPNSNFLVCDALHLPFRREVFQNVMMWHVLEHLFDQEGVMQEISRVTSEQGFVLIGTPNSHSWYSRDSFLGKVRRGIDGAVIYMIRKIRGRKKQAILDRGGGHVRIWGPKELSEGLLEHGLVSEKLRLDGFIPPLSFLLIHLACKFDSVGWLLDLWASIDSFVSKIPLLKYTNRHITLLARKLPIVQVEQRA